MPYKAVSPEISTDELSQGFTRADIEFLGIDHSGCSYEGRVFLNNPDADATTATTEENGYAGSIYIFGHGGCFGDEGHCDVSPPDSPYDPRPVHPLWPGKKVLIATDAVRRAVAAGPTMTVTVVPIVTATTEKCEDDDQVLRFESLAVVTYD